MRWKALAGIYTTHSFASFWNRIPKNEENHGGEKILVQSREKWPGEAHRQLQLSTQCYPRARTRIKAVWQACEYTWDTMTIPRFRLVELTANRMSFVRISCGAKLIDKVPRSPLHRSLISIFSSKIAQFFSRLKKWISDFFQFLRRILHFSAIFYEILQHIVKNQQTFSNF